MVGYIDAWYRGFGFINFCPAGAGRLSSRIYFNESAWQSEYVPRFGGRIEFDLGIQTAGPKQGSPIAKNVRPAYRDRSVGRVCSIVQPGYSGFIELKGSLNPPHIYFHTDDFVVDQIGRRFPMLGDQVSFEILELEDTCQRAVYVQNENPQLEKIDLRDYREVGTIAFLNEQFGKITRPNNEEIAFWIANCPDAETFSVGGPVEYSICLRNIEFDTKKSRWRHACYATDVTFPGYSVDSAEAHFLHAPELPLSSSPSEVSANSEVVYTAEQRKTSLRDLIARGK